MSNKYLNILTGKCNEDIVNPAMDFPYELDHFQKYSCIAISKDENVLVTAHTGSGKTAIAEYAIAHYSRKGKRVVYTSPIKTLSNQKYSEFRDKFESDDTTVGLMTGDNKIAPNADIVVMTTEILRNTLYEMDKDLYFEDNFIEKVGCVIFDEVHYINDKDRGHVWEETINLLNPNITLVMLSATIDKAEEFASWIGDIKHKPINLVPTDHRVVPLEHFIYIDNKLHKILDKNNNFDNNNFDNAYKSYKIIQNDKKSSIYYLNKSIKYLYDNDMLQTIFFSFSRKNCEKYAKSVSKNLITEKEGIEAAKLFDKYMLKYVDQYGHIDQYGQVRRLIEKGVCYHHSGLLSILKEIIEIIFEKGYIKVLFATETFAVGVNMPTRSIVFTALEKHTSEGIRSLFTSEYKQMSGRAGRRGIDKHGYVVILPLYEFPDKQDLRHMMLGRAPSIHSKFTINYSFILKIIRSSNKNFTEFINSSLYDRFNSNQILLDKQNIKEPLEPNMSNNSIEFINFLKEEDKLKSMGFTLNKKQIKNKKKLLQQVNKEEVEVYKRYQEDIVKYRYDLDRISYMENYVNYESEKVIELLYNYSYINTLLSYDKLTDANITMKGILASQINECNPLLLTEIITKDLFDDMTAEEIVGLIGIFIIDSKDGYMFSEIKQELSENLVFKINIVHDIIEDYTLAEKNIGICTDDNFWSISYDYAFAGYLWANQCTLQDIFNKLNIYEGNFVRNLLKINNIVQDLINLHHIYDNLKVIPTLESIQELILRDIVTVNSLYVE